MTMDKDPAKSSVSPASLAALLGMGVDAGGGPVSRTEWKAELLRVRLAGMLPPDARPAGDLQAAPGRPGQAFLPLRGRAIRETLLDTAARIEDIIRIKEYGRHLSQREDCEAEHVVGVAIYYAAIASALLFHGVRASKYGFSELAEAFRLVGGKRWLPAAFCRHFAKARKLCDSKRP